MIIFSFYFHFKLIYLRRIKIGAKHIMPVFFSLSFFVFRKYLLDDLNQHRVRVLNFTHTTNINILYRIIGGIYYIGSLQYNICSISVRFFLKPFNT